MHKNIQGKYLTTEEIKTYCHIITALSHTIDLQKQIDNLYNDVEKDLIEYEEK